MKKTSKIQLRVRKEIENEEKRNRIMRIVSVLIAIISIAISTIAILRTIK
jgi:hypothetical protein